MFFAPPKSVKTLAYVTVVSEQDANADYPRATSAPASQVQLQPQGNIASQALIAAAKQPTIWCIAGASEASS